MLTHLDRLEAESIHIMRETVAEADRPVMLYSIGKDSAALLHLAEQMAEDATRQAENAADRGRVADALTRARAALGPDGAAPGPWHRGRREGIPWWPSRNEFPEGHHLRRRWIKQSRFDRRRFRCRIELPARRRSALTAPAVFDGHGRGSDRAFKRVGRRHRATGLLTLTSERATFGRRPRPDPWSS